MQIRLIEPLTAGQVTLLSRIGVTISEDQSVQYLNVPDTRNTYCKNIGYNYDIHCCDDTTPVATLFIKDNDWDRVQRVIINQRQIEIAEKQLSDASPFESTTYPDYEERRERTRAGDCACLFEIPFSDLRFDEQDIVRAKGYQREGSEQYLPLSQRGLAIVKLFRDTEDQLRFLLHPIYASTSSSLFAAREDAQERCYQHHKQIWNSLLEGTHPLTSGMSDKQIGAYFDIAQHRKVSADFQETAEIVSETIASGTSEATARSSSFSR